MPVTLDTAVKEDGETADARVDVQGISTWERESMVVRAPILLAAVPVPAAGAPTPPVSGSPVVFAVAWLYILSVPVLKVASDG